MLAFRAFPFMLASLTVAGCVTDAPEGPDSQGPTVTVQVQNAVGAPKLFRSTDPASDGACALVRGFPVSFVLSANDPGGVRSASLRVFPGTIDRASVTIPTAADISHTVTAREGSETLTVTLTRPAPGRVRTGVIATFKAMAAAGGQPDFAVLAEATDHAGNRTFLNQIDLRPANSGFICD